MKKLKNGHIAFWILSKFLPSEERSYLLGDYKELYSIKLRTDGKTRSSIWLWLQVLQSIPKFIESRFSWGLSMFKNYLKLAYRILIKNGISSVINVIGLSIALAIAIFSYVFFDFHYNRDSFHENKENIFLVCNKINHNGVEQTWGNSPLPMGPQLKADFPSVKRVVRINNSYLKVRHDDRVFNERVQFVSEEYFDMFSFPLQYSVENPLTKKNSVVLSKAEAEKYFGEANALGKELIIFINDKVNETYTVTAVGDEMPNNASFEFNILIPFQKYLDYNLADEDNWKELITATFVQLNDPQEITTIAGNSNSYVSIQNDFDPDRPMVDFHYESLTTLAKNSYRIMRDLVYVSLHPGQTLSTLFIGIALLVLAAFNYMNITISSSAKRFKEIGVRKVLGTSRKGLVYQFLSENIILCGIALLAGLVLAKYVVTPWFNSLWGVFNLEVNLFNNLGLIIYLAILLVSIAVFSGLYPAFYISRFEVTSIFRSKAKIGGSKPITKVLLTLQLMISFMTVVYGVVFVENNEYWSTRDWGYEKENVVFVPLEYNGQFETYKNAVESLSSVSSVAGSYGHIGYSMIRTGVEVDDVKHAVHRFDFGYDYLETVGIDIAKGRSFDRNISTDLDNAIIVNETFVNLIQWQEPLQKRILLEEKPYYVVGVVKDFHYNNFMSKIEPLIILASPDSSSRFLTASVAGGQLDNTLAEMEANWKKEFPNSPFEGRYQEDVWGEFLPSMDALARLSKSLAIIGLLITCMGIFAQVTITISSKMKEVGIRKVLGSSNFSLVKLVNKSFVKIAIIATILAVPISHYAMKSLLDSMWDYHKPLDWTPFIFSFTAILLSAIITTLSQVYKAIKANPVDTIRIE